MSATAFSDSFQINEAPHVRKYRRPDGVDVFWLAIGCIGIAAMFVSCCPMRGAEPTVITGKVVSIADGDTLTVLVGKTQKIIRLGEIDCPETYKGKKSPGQPYGDKAKDRTADLAFAEVVSVAVSGVDRYGRSIGTVTLPDGSNLNATLVGEGLAWHYKSFSKSKELAALEQTAREQRTGLWAEKDKKPQPPWEYRRKLAGKAPLPEPKPASKSKAKAAPSRRTPVRLRS